MKAINRRVGYDSGDHFLRTIASKIKVLIMDCEGVLIRLDGDKFLVVSTRLYGCESQWVERVNKNLMMPLLVSGHSIPCSLNFGFSRFPDDGKNIDKLISMAESNILAMRNSVIDGMNN